jgi:hypothetical protein
MAFNVKSDLRRKARLVVGGHKVNADEHTRAIITATTPECALKRKHVALSYHFVRE